MNLEQATIVLRPRGVLGVADLAFRFVATLRRRLWVLLWCLFVLPGWLAAVALQHLAGVEWVWIWLLVIVYGSVAQGVFTSAAGLLLFDRHARFGAIALGYLRRAPTHALVTLFTRVLALATAASVLGLYFGIRWAFVHEAVLLEQATVLKATGRSAAFIRHHADDVIGMMLVLLGINAIGIVSVEVLGHGMEQLFMLPVHATNAIDEGGSEYALLGYFLSLPLCSVVRFLCYVDGRTRRDGWDIQVRFMAIGAAEEARAKDSSRLEATQ